MVSTTRAAVGAVLLSLALAACGGGAVDWSKRGTDCSHAACGEGLTCVTSGAASTCERLCSDGCDGLSCLSAGDVTCSTPGGGPSICACKSL